MNPQRRWEGAITNLNKGFKIDSKVGSYVPFPYLFPLLLLMVINVEDKRIEEIKKEKICNVGLGREERCDGKTLSTFPSLVSGFIVNGFIALLLLTIALPTLISPVSIVLLGLMTPSRRRHY